MTKHQINSFGFLLVLLSSSLILGFGDELMLIIILSFLVFSAILLIGVFRIQFNYFTKSIHRTNSDLCLLTFDDGPNEEFTPIILEILRRNRVGAIFFVIGAKAELNNKLFQQIITEGHLVGNHTYSHFNSFAFKSKATIDIEVGKAENVLNINSSSLFRSPIGIINPIISRVLKQRKLRSIGWSLRSLDTVNSNRNKLLNRLQRKVKKGDIILLHDNLKVTAEIIETFILQAQKDGIKFASPSDLNNILNE